MSATHDPLCPLAPYAQRIAEGEWDAGAFIDDDGKVQYLGCDCDLIARVVERERGAARSRVEALAEANEVELDDMFQWRDWWNPEMDARQAASRSFRAAAAAAGGDADG